MKIATLVASAAVLISLSMPANAQESLAKFIEHYNGIEVRLHESAAKCDAHDKDVYAKKVGDGLQAIGITPAPQAITRAYLFIMAVPFGALGHRCATFMSLRLGADVSSALAKVEVKTTSDKVLIERVKVVSGTFPAAFYLTSRLFVKSRLETPETVLKVIELLLKDVDENRKS